MIDVPPSPGLEPDEAPQWGDKPSKGSRGAMHVHAYAPAVTPKLHNGELLSIVMSSSTDYATSHCQPADASS